MHRDERTGRIELCLAWTCVPAGEAPPPPVTGLSDIPSHDRRFRRGFERLCETVHSKCPDPGRYSRTGVSVRVLDADCVGKCTATGGPGS